LAVTLHVDAGNAHAQEGRQPKVKRFSGIEGNCGLDGHKAKIF
jgi:hypothetical protein